ncbi:MAG: arsenate reductase family protein [Intestinibacillus sp.]
MYIFVCYPKCTTCQKAQKWLDAHGISYTVRHIKEQNPGADELRAWQQASGLPVRRFFNTSGQLYRGMELSAKLPGMNEDEQFALLATDGMLVKRPILTDGDTVLVGFKEAEWANALEARE